ncbi:MAG TPA: hypothetical protein PL152_01145 [Steroidobacteraceae bacterium]|nr:hypothetical protein [Steroidobacteraceae bacterium]
MGNTLRGLRHKPQLPGLAASLRTLNAWMRALVIQTAAVQAVWSAALQRNLDRGRRI